MSTTKLLSIVLAGLIFCILMVLFVGCQTNNAVVHEGAICTINNVSVKVVEIDGCEYLWGGEYGGMAHKGNCKYCRDRRHAEQEANWIMPKK